MSVWVRSVGLSWAGFVELSSVGWVSESGVRGHHHSIISCRSNLSPCYVKRPKTGCIFKDSKVELFASNTGLNDNRKM